MTYEVTGRTFAHNTTPTDATTALLQGKSFLLQLKNFLVASAGWTVVLSSNATTASAADNWSALSDITFVTTSGVHSWIVLKSPEGIVAGADGSSTGDQSRVWLVIDCLGATGGSTANFYFDRIAYTGGTTSLKPTGSADELRLNAANTNFQSSGLSISTFHFACEPNGSFTARISANGNGVSNFNFCCNKLINVPTIISSGLPHPYGINFRACTNSSSTLASDLLGSSATGLFNLTNNAGWNYDGTAATNILFANYNLAATGFFGVSTGSGGNVYNNYNEASALWVVNNTTAKYGAVGKIPDHRVSSASVGNGTQSPPSGAIEYVFLSGNWVPSDVILSL